MDRGETPSRHRPPPDRVLVAEVLYGRLAAMEPSMLDLLCRLARPHDGVLGYVPTLPDAQAPIVNHIRLL